MYFSYQIMIELFQSQDRVLANTSASYTRSLKDKLPWKERAIMITGARGTGKTTLLLQHIKENFSNKEALYVTLDDLYFKENNIVDTALSFSQGGGKVLVLDEVHKYPNWSQEVKNIYDLIPDLKLLITGSSILEMEKSSADLSRRVLVYQLSEMSFREFLGIKYGIELPIFGLKDILNNSDEVARQVIKKIKKPIFYFKEYCKMGAYPFFVETDHVYLRLKQSINVILENDMPNVINLETKTLHQLQRLLYIIAQSVPYSPNVTKLAEHIGVGRVRLYDMLKMLQAAKLIYGLYASNTKTSGMSKPEKIYLHNTTLMHALSAHTPENGHIRECFFINMLDSAGHQVNYTKKGDFLINEQYSFEVGGKSKSQKQIKGINNSFLALDEIETGVGNIIPLWLFGFLY